ncbi:MAG: sigma-70 family RNA polymerase sigma factor [Anaerolineaceae bacterium]|nr:sigma-70 family RNA polymerase sigma factor [Anaerolineaceae bacterium]
MATDQQSITHLIVRAKQGDAAAIGELYERYRLGVYRYFFYRSGDTHIADDLTSEVFIRMIRALSGYKLQNGLFQAWLYQIAHNLLNDHYRKTGNHNHIELEENTMNDPVFSRSRPVEHSLNGVALNQALKVLSNEQRDVIVMRFISEMSIAEVAQTIHKSEDAVKGLQRRALSSLRAVLADLEVHYA